MNRSLLSFLRECIYGEKEENIRGEKNQYDINIDNFISTKIISKLDSNDYE
ncbi:hypothetical protein [Chryseobacterium nematophagum]|uniref:hypothetical protein n=1 Tax=Chryseobacterium nematophagum TaxID=2305228 RepID=UPI00160546EF|nr:hypothetical protein [Chryseobacterium nematophagum]